MNPTDNLNRDWNFDVNLSGLQAPTGMSTALPEGFYKMKITDMYVGEKPGRVIIKSQVIEGPFAGTIRTDGLNMPKDENDNVRYYWRALAESAGYTPAQLDAGQVNLTRSSFVDKEAHLRYTPKDEEKGLKYERFVWLSAAEWSQQKQGFEARDGGTPTATPTTNNGSGGSTTTKKDVVAQLGL